MSQVMSQVGVKDRMKKAVIRVKHSKYLSCYRVKYWAK